MISIKYPNGYVGEYDETLIPGELVCAYRKGYHEFVKFVDRGNDIIPLAQYKLRFDINGKSKKSSTIHECDASYVRRAKSVIDMQIIELHQTIERLKKLSVGI